MQDSAGRKAQVVEDSARERRHCRTMQESTGRAGQSRTVQESAGSAGQCVYWFKSTVQGASTETSRYELLLSETCRPVSLTQDNSFQHNPTEEFFFKLTRL